ncbi:MAG: cupin [Thermoguttaceae bacterium]|nr:cupin [Thermoguttaceae bacterium]
MPRLLSTPTRFPQDGIAIDEFVGRASNGDVRVSIARLSSGAGWSEPPQRPEFDEYSLIISGALRATNVETGEAITARAGEVLFVPKGEKIQYSTPEADGADYVAICLPAFAPDLARRDPE